MLIDNINFLRDNYRHLRETIIRNEEQLKSFPLEVIVTKTGLPTLQVKHNSRPLFLHSKYDPIKEAERLVEQYEKDIEDYDHIFFYGIGFGYHVESFLEKYPNMKFTLYEPSPAVFYEYMNNRNITELPVKNLQNLFVEWNEELGSQFLEQFAFNMKDNVLLVILPSYTRAFPIQFEQFSNEFKNKVQKKGMSHAANAVFAKRWTLNSLMNLPTTLTTPNILVDKKRVFENKPVLLVSAGPSLADEYDNLRHIKENGLAYIFAVGSANKALVANDILPDAVLTYDPQPHNYNVFKPMYENHIDTVPMIYGTSVGYETLEYYQGPKLHFITSQDTITPYFAKDTIKQSDIVNDDFSIAIVTLQILAKMNAGPVILVGQNFAFRDNLFYSKDIKRGNKSAEVQEKDVEKALHVKDVYGNQVKTNESFNQMRLAMETAITSIQNLEILNTTKGGAAIQGAPFVTLEDIMEQRLKEKVVVEDWYASDDSNNIYQQENKKLLQQAMNQFIKDYEKVYKVLQELHQSIQKKNMKKIEQSFVNFDKQFHKFINNHFYLTIIQPMVRIQFEKLQNDISQLNKNTNQIEKAKQLIRASELYLQATRQVYNEVSPFVNQVFNEEVKGFKQYKSDCGVFSYSDGWEKQAIKIEEKSPSTALTYHLANKADAKIKFKFQGTSMRILAGTRKDLAEKIEVKIDNKVTTFSTKSNTSPQFVFKANETVFELNGLANGMHEVEITLLEDKPFVFNGVEINQDGRLYHIDEVIKVEELKIGKRIRCHYKATYNKVGEFSGLGEETKGFIPPESSAFPDGDFYFIMVDESDEEGKKLIADRNVQHSISWMTLNNDDMIFRNKVIKIGDYTNCYFGLVRGGSLSQNDNDNEWDQYNISSSSKFSISHLVWQTEILGCHPQLKIQHILARGVNQEKNDYKTISTESNVLDYIGYLPLVVIR